jgi:aspartyl protease family protein
MADPDRDNPWRRNPPPERAGSKTGLVLWLIIVIGMGLAVWKLSELFPGQVNSDYSKAQLISMMVILAMVSSSVLFIRRTQIKEVVRNIAIWLALAVVLIVGLSYRTELESVALRIRSELVPGYASTTEPGVLVLNESSDGHFYAISEANGVRVRFLIDTGATDTVLSPADAERLGIDVKALDYSKVYGTANGLGRGAPYTLSTLEVGPIALSNVPISINETEMGSSLLGMSFLKRLRSYEVQDRRLYLRWQ